VDAFVAKYGKPERDGCAGVWCLYAVVDAIERANSFDPKAIRDAMAATENFEGVTGYITINDTGDAVKDAVVLEVRDGAFKYLTTVKP